jgi:sugar phosphate isomerase/epimerase
MSAATANRAAMPRLAVHTVTTKPLAIEQAVEEYARRGVAGITVWRDALDGRDTTAVRRRIADAGLAVVSMARGGFFAHAHADERAAAIEDNRHAIRTAKALGAPTLVLVCGADPAQPLALSRTQIADGIAELIPQAADAGVRLLVEPLHPMYADTRSAISTLRDANDLCDQLASPQVGVAVDVYHLWWDPTLRVEIARCGRSGYLGAFHVCDWRTPTRDLLLDRGLPGDGCIPIREIRGWVEDAGFGGFDEVEVFSTDYWSRRQTDVLDLLVDRYTEHVL